MYGVENGNPLQYSCLGNSMDRGSWWPTVHGVAELDTTEHKCLDHMQCQLFPNIYIIKLYLLTTEN